MLLYGNFLHNIILPLQVLSYKEKNRIGRRRSKSRRVKESREEKKQEENDEEE